MARNNPHIIETKAKDKVRTLIDNYDERSAIFRDITERDYGVDGLVEIFKNDNPTGEIAFVQIKGTQSKIVPMKSNPKLISIPISVSNCLYCKQKNIPFLLIYTSIDSDDCFYFCKLQDSDELNQISDFNNQNSKSIHIPISYNTLENFEKFFELIEEYYKE